MRVRSLLAMTMMAVAAWAASPARLAAQDSTGGAAPTASPQDAPEQNPAPRHVLGPAEIVMPHITDSKTVDLPCFNAEWSCEWHLPTWPVHIGNATIDLGPTKFVFFMLVAAALCLITLGGAAWAHVRATAKQGHPKGFAAGVESVVLILRNVFKEALGPHGEGYIPFVLTLFFFILFMNLMGLLPYGEPPTGNLGVNATLAACAFIATETAGMIALGPMGYLKTIVYWPSDVELWIKSWLTFIMTPVEIISKFTKPFALTVRLFANMIAGHIIVLTMIGLALLFGSWLVAFLGPIPMALGIMLLEVLVSFIQAFIFALLTAVFIGLIRTAQH